MFPSVKYTVNQGSFVQLLECAISTVIKEIRRVIFLVLTVIFLLKQVGLQYMVVFLLFRISNTLLLH